MVCIKEENDGNIVFKLEGWLDTVSSPELGLAIEEIKEAKSIVLDFDKVEYMASAGLRQVVSCFKKAKELGASFKVINACTETMSIFKLTEIDKKIEIIGK